MEYTKEEENILTYYHELHPDLAMLLSQVTAFFEKDPQLNKKPFPIIHSMKSRYKDDSHLIDKIRRKAEVGRIITCENLLKEVNDLIGVRILYLYQDQFQVIHNQLLTHIGKDWKFIEAPKAYTWDPESKSFFDSIGIKTEVKDSYYTSVHYVITANNDYEPPICCEIQVRTLFEEIWGEIDHIVNYPHPTDNLSCQEQLKVLSKLVSTGTRLADSIFHSYNSDKSS